MDLEDDQYLENQDDDLLGDDDLLPAQDEHDDNEGSERSGRGDLNVALRKEREKRRLAEEQLAQKDADLQRREALLQQLGQNNNRREEPRVDPDAFREQLVDRLYTRPDEVLNQRDQHLMSQMVRQQAPLYIKAAKMDIADDPEFGDFYKTRPGFKTAADAYIQDCVTAYGQVNPDNMRHVLGLLANVAKDGGSASSNKSAKDKLTSIADKSGGTSNRKTPSQILEDKAKLSNRDYSKWADSPEGKRVLNEALKASG